MDITVNPDMVCFRRKYCQKLRQTFSQSTFSLPCSDNPLDFIQMIKDTEAFGKKLYPNTRKSNNELLSPGKNPHIRPETNMSTDTKPCSNLNSKEDHSQGNDRSRGVESGPLSGDRSLTPGGSQKILKTGSNISLLDQNSRIDDLQGKPESVQ
jgi:hypothetical protein